MSHKILRQNCKHCSRKASFFQYLNDDELDLIDRNRYEIEYFPGETIFKQGSPSTHVLSFNHGIAKICVEGSFSRNMILRLIKPGEFIAGPGIFIENKHHFTITALDRSSVCVIDNEAFKSVIHSNRVFMDAYLKMLNYNYLKTIQRLSSQVQKQSKGKLAESILYLSQEVYGKEIFPLNLSLREIGELSGISKEGTARTLKEFADDKLIRFNRKEMEILNSNLLTEISLKG